LDQSPGGSSDGLDDEVWRRLVGVIAAAHREDKHALAGLLDVFDVGLSEERRRESSGYLYYILRFVVGKTLVKRPTAEDLHQLAAQIYPRYSKVLIVPITTLEDTFRVYLKLPQTGDPLDGSQLFVSAAVAAGVLLKDPAAELASIRPGLARWRFHDFQDAKNG
jgi:hypothetical protein